MKKWLRIRGEFNICCAAVLFLSMLTAYSFSAFAGSTPDLSQSGSISIELTYDGETVSGSEITIYRVACIILDNGNYYYALTDEFSGCGLSLDIDDEKASKLMTLADELAGYAAQNDISGVQAVTGSTGRVTVSDLDAGLYLVVQTKAADGYEAFLPFLVSVPVYDETTDAYVYDVDASPKVSLNQEQEETDAPDEEETKPQEEDETGPAGEEEETESSDGEKDETGSPGGEEEETEPTDEEEGETEPTDEQDETELSKGNEDDKAPSAGDTGTGQSDSSAQTGDPSNIRLWFILFSMSVMILLILMCRIRHEKDKD